MPFRTISFPQHLKDHGVREDDCPVWGVQWTNTPETASTIARTHHDTTGSSSRFATSDEAEAELNELLEKESKAPVASKPKRSTRKKRTSTTGPSTTVDTQELTGPQTPALPSNTLLPQREPEPEPISPNIARFDGPRAGVPSHAVSRKLGDAPRDHDPSAPHAQTEALALRAPSTFSSLAGAIREVPNVAAGATATHVPFHPISSYTPTWHTARPFQQPAATMSSWELSPHNTTPASNTPTPPYAPKFVGTSHATPYASVPFGSAQSQAHDYAPRNSFQRQAFQPPYRPPTQGFGHMSTLPVFESPAPRPAFNAAGVNTRGGASAPASTQSFESLPWSVAPRYGSSSTDRSVWTPQGYESPSTDRSVWTPATPVTPSPVYWEGGEVSRVNTPGGVSQGGFASFEQYGGCAAPHVQHASEPYSGSSYGQQGVSDAEEWPPYTSASYGAPQNYYWSSK